MPSYSELLASLSLENLMPLPEDKREEIHLYCVRDLPGDAAWHANLFDFIENDELKKRLGRAFYTGRYVAKLMEALSPEGEFAHPFVKFQIIQYASIYEAVISYMLFEKYKNHQEVVDMGLHKAYKPVDALGRITKMKYGEDEIYTCTYKDTKTPKNSIPFSQKVDCAVRIGLIKEEYSGNIKDTYNLRNSAHLEAEAQRLIEVELAQSHMGYWRLKPFLEDIVSFIENDPDYIRESAQPVTEPVIGFAADEREPPGTDS